MKLGGRTTDGYPPSGILMLSHCQSTGVKGHGYGWGTVKIILSTFHKEERRVEHVLGSRKKVVNLTPHVVNIIKEDGKVIKFPPSGTVARVFTDYVRRGSLGEIDIVDTILGDVFDLPPPKPQTTYIVSRMVLTACQRRRDLVVPHDVVRDKNGRILGARCFARR